jgi:hypothetical protein
MMALHRQQFLLTLIDLADKQQWQEFVKMAAFSQHDHSMLQASSSRALADAIICPGQFVTCPFTFYFTISSITT